MSRDIYRVTSGRKKSVFFLSALSHLGSSIKTVKYPRKRREKNSKSSHTLGTGEMHLKIYIYVYIADKTLVFKFDLLP